MTKDKPSDEAVEAAIQLYDYRCKDCTCKYYDRYLEDWTCAFSDIIDFERKACPSLRLSKDAQNYTEPSEWWKLLVPYDTVVVKSGTNHAKLLQTLGDPEVLTDYLQDCTCCPVADGCPYRDDSDKWDECRARIKAWLAS